MKSIISYIKESEEKNNVFVVYFNDGTMYNYYTNKEEANKVKDQLNQEMPDNKCTIKEEPLSNFEK